jgi:shikimate dehydrogenase
MGNSRQTILLGLIGQGIALSRSPAMHMNEASANGLTSVYQKIDLEVLQKDVSHLGELLNSAKNMGFTGLNITYPCKQAIIPLLDDLSPDAKALQAVNTVVFKNGKAIGHNTDCYGYAENFRQNLQDADYDKVVQFGTGGAGVAVSHALLCMGVKQLTLIDLDETRVDEAIRLLEITHGKGKIVKTKDREKSVKAANGIVNCTPIGMAKLPGTAFPTQWLKPSQWVSEIVYFPLETQLLKEAKAIGCKVVNGSGMTIYQAVEAFRLFTGVEPDARRMQATFQSFDEVKS